MQCANQHYSDFEIKQHCASYLHGSTEIYQNNETYGNLMYVLNNSLFSWLTDYSHLTITVNILSKPIFSGIKSC